MGQDGLVWDVKRDTGSSNPTASGSAFFIWGKEKKNSVLGRLEIEREKNSWEYERGK